MFELKIIEKNGQQVMSSVDLAKLCIGESKYAHRDFIRKASSVLGSSAVGKFSHRETYNNNNERTILLLPERESCLMAMSYSYELQAKVYDRWKLLEQQSASTPALPDFTDPVAAARAWADEVEAKEKALLTVEQQAPVVEYHDKVLDTSSCMTISVIAKDLGMSGMKLNKLLSSLRIQYKQGRQWLLYSEHQDKGYVDTSTYHNGSDSTYHNTVWTEKGRQFIINQLKKAELI